MFAKRDNKKGQEGLTLTTLLLIILGIVVVVVIIIGATKGFGFIFGKVDALPGQSLQTAIESCNIAAQQDLKADYCLDVKQVELNGVEQYVTCHYLGEGDGVDVVGQKLLDENLEGGCSGGYLFDQASISAFCDSSSGKLKDSQLVNGKSCGSVRGTDSP